MTARSPLKTTSPDSNFATVYLSSYRVHIIKLFSGLTVVHCSLPGTPRCHTERHPARSKIACVGNNSITKPTHKTAIVCHHACDEIFQALSPFIGHKAGEEPENEASESSRTSYISLIFGFSSVKSPLICNSLQ